MNKKMILIKQLRLLIAEWLMRKAFDLMPDDAEEKKFMAKYLIDYSIKVIK